VLKCLCGYFGPLDLEDFGPANLEDPDPARGRGFWNWLVDTWIWLVHLSYFDANCGSKVLLRSHGFH